FASIGPADRRRTSQSMRNAGGVRVDYQPMPPASPPCPQAAQKPARTPAQTVARTAPQSPVFVDDTGRRHRMVRVVGWVVGGLTLSYLALLGVSLVGSPGLVPLSLPAIGSVLPGPSAPQI